MLALVASHRAGSIIAATHSPFADASRGQGFAGRRVPEPAHGVSAIVADPDFATSTSVLPANVAPVAANAVSASASPTRPNSRLPITERSTVIKNGGGEVELRRCLPVSTGAGALVKRCMEISAGGQCRQRLLAAGHRTPRRSAANMITLPALAVDKHAVSRALESWDRGADPMSHRHSAFQDPRGSTGDCVAGREQRTWASGIF
jgi:hypothetical protein